VRQVAEIHRLGGEFESLVTLQVGMASNTEQALGFVSPPDSHVRSSKTLKQVQFGGISIEGCVGGDTIPLGRISSSTLRTATPVNIDFWISLVIPESMLLVS
jgi:hypothetical protein